MIDPPTTIKAESILTTSIQVSWSEATCLSSCPVGITSYVYELQLHNGHGIKSGTTGANERTVTFTGLTPCTLYVFIVAAFSDSVLSNAQSESIPTAGEG